MLFLTRLFGGTGDLERQFEFVLKGWINASKFQGLDMTRTRSRATATAPAT